MSVDNSRRTIPLNPRPGFSAYHLMTSLVVPRPIAWISTRSENGAENLAPFSFFQAVSDSPPVLMISIGTKKSKLAEPKDTLSNIEATGAFVVNLVPDELTEVMVRTAAEYPAGQSEFAELGLHSFPGQRVDAPCLVESPVNIECLLYSKQQVGDAMVVFGEVVLVHALDRVLNERGLVDAEKLRAVARLGESWYQPYAGRRRVDRP